MAEIWIGSASFIFPYRNASADVQVVRGPAPLSLALAKRGESDGKVVLSPWTETDFRDGENPPPPPPPPPPTPMTALCLHSLVWCSKLFWPISLNFVNYHFLENWSARFLNHTFLRSTEA